MEPKENKMTTYRLSALEKKNRLALLNGLRSDRIPYKVKWNKKNKEYLILTEDTKENVK